MRGDVALGAVVNVASFAVAVAALAFSIRRWSSGSPPAMRVRRSLRLLARIRGETAGRAEAHVPSSPLTMYR
jgi:hypothetical protein